MAVRCSKCGEELLGAVNRCWKCGQTFALHPEIDGRPPVRAESAVGGGQALEAIIVEQAGTLPTAPAVAVAVQRWVQPSRASTGDLIDARRAGMMAMGGTVTSIVLGVFAATFALVWPPAALIAVLGLAMGVWGLSSPKRNWALIGMLLCCLAIGIGTYGGVRSAYVYMQRSKPIAIDSDGAPTDTAP
jgi:hypothetical protein